MKSFFVATLCAFIGLASAKHFLLYSRPAHEMQTYNSYFASQHLCSTDFAIKLRNDTRTNDTRTNETAQSRESYPVYMHDIFTD